MATSPSAAKEDNSAEWALDNTQLLDRVHAPCIQEEQTQCFLRTHGRLLLLVRGPPGSGKNIIVAELEELYPDSRAYWSDKLFSSPMAPQRNSVTIRESHDLCHSKIEGFMKNDVPMIINKNTNVMVWEIAKFLVLASRYGYTVILVDIPRHIVLDPKVLTVTNNKGLGEQYLTSRVKQWEEVHPFAMGWSPRPKDAAWLLQRFQQLRAALHEEDSTLDLKAIANTCVFPFCLARLCLFGRAKTDSDYCSSEKVRKAYGRSDTIRVFGYAITKGFIFAMVELSDDQASLTRCNNNGGGDGSGGGADEDIDEVTLRFLMSLSPSNWEEVACIVDLTKFTTKDGGSDGEDGLRSTSEQINLEGMCTSKITFMPLGSMEGTEYCYSRAVTAPWKLLSSKLRFWTGSPSEGAACTKKIAGVGVYGSTSSADDACLLVYDAAVELEAIFTGYYQPHTTVISGNSWSQTQRMASRARPRRSWPR